MLRGQEIVRKREEIIKMLNQALASEGLAAYRYLFLAQWVTGHGAHEAAEIFTLMAAEEQAHVAKFLGRIVQLGGTPLLSPSDWEKHTDIKYKAPPKDPSRLKDILEDSIEAERAAISFYQKLAELAQHNDHVTYNLVIQVLADEVQDEQKLETFLR